MNRESRPGDKRKTAAPHHKPAAEDKAPFMLVPGFPERSGSVPKSSGHLILGFSARS
jgi:hypothetical protein